MNVRLLIAGASGLVGAELARCAESNAFTTLCTARNVRGRAKTALDLTDHDAVKKTIDQFQPTLIALCAGFNWVDGCERDPEKSERENVSTVRAVLDAVRGTSTGVISYSTDHVFDGENNPYTESAPTHALSTYAKDKLRAEELARAHAEHLVVRTAYVFGEELLKKNFVAQVVRASKERRALALPKDQAGSPTWSSWLASSSLSAFVNGTRGLLHLVGPESLTKAEWARRIIDRLELEPIEVREVSWAESGQVAPRPTRVVLASDHENFAHPPLDIVLRQERARLLES